MWENKRPISWQLSSKCQKVAHFSIFFRKKALENLLDQELATKN